MRGHPSTVEATVGYPPAGILTHSLTIAGRNGRSEVTNERVEPSGTDTDERARLVLLPPTSGCGDYLGDHKNNRRDGTRGR